MKTRRPLVLLTAALLLGAFALSSCSNGETAVAAARKQLGVTYTYGGSTTASGFDCSGLTSYAWKQAGITLPRTSAQQYAGTTRITKAQLQPGDLVFYSASGPKGTVSHVGLYAGNGKMIHASSSNDRVEEVSLATYWTDHLVGYGRVKGATPPATTTTTAPTATGPTAR